MAGACVRPVCGGEIRDAPATLIEERGIVVAGDSFALLTGTETIVLRELITRYPDIASKERIHHTMYAMDRDGGALEKIVDVMICKLRKKISPLGIEITTSWGRGYGLGVKVDLRAAEVDEP